MGSPRRTALDSRVVGDVEDRQSTLEAQLAAMSSARRRQQEGESDFAAAREEAHRALRLLGLAHLVEGTVPDGDLVRRLYWEEPALKVEAIGAAFGWPTNDVHNYAGEGLIRAPCEGCGEVMLEHSVTSRTAAQAELNAWYRDWRYCDPCREERRRVDERRAMEAQDERRRYDEEVARVVDEARRTGRFTRLLEIPTDFGTLTVRDDQA